MSAKEMFYKLGYKEKICNNEIGIQYIKKSEDSEMQRIGMIITKFIEFYTSHKKIVIYTTYEHKNGSKSSGEFGSLNIEEFNAIQKQIFELGWQE